MLSVARELLFPLVTLLFWPMLCALALGLPRWAVGAVPAVTIIASGAILGSPSSVLFAISSVALFFIGGVLAIEFIMRTIFARAIGFQILLVVMALGLWSLFFVGEHSRESARNLYVLLGFPVGLALGSFQERLERGVQLVILASVSLVLLYLLGLLWSGLSISFLYDLDAQRFHEYVRRFTPLLALVLLASGLQIGSAVNRRIIADGPPKGIASAIAGA